MEELPASMQFFLQSNIIHCTRISKNFVCDRWVSRYFWILSDV